MLALGRGVVRAGSDASAWAASFGEVGALSERRPLGRGTMVTGRSHASGGAG
jgi:hypothetical protein